MRKGIAGKKEAWIIIAIGLTALLLYTACGTTPTVPVERKVVEFGNLTPLTGPTSAAEQSGWQGMEDYVRYFNEEKSIPGVVIKHSWIDTDFQMSLAISAYRKSIDRGVVCLYSNHAEALPGVVPNLGKDRVPMVTGIQNDYLYYPPGWVYGVAPTYAEIFTVLADYIRENWQEERPPRLAFMGIDAQFTWGAVEQGTKYAESIGIEILPTEIVPMPPLDTSTQLLRLSERGADFVYIQMIPVVTLPILRDAERLGLLGEIQFGGSDYSFGEVVIKGAGAACEGYLLPKVTPWWDETEVPGIKLMIDNQMKYHGKEVSERFPGYDGCWRAAAVICEAIRRAGEKVGYENVDGRAVKEALDSMKDFDIYGLSTVSYTPEDHRGCTRAAVYQVKDGKVIRVSDWRETPMLVPGG